MSSEKLPSPGYYKPRQRVTQVQLTLDGQMGGLSGSSGSSGSGANDAGFENSSTDSNNLDVEEPLGSPVARSLAKDRRTCKSFRGEIVWPPKVEAALVEALEELLPGAIQSCVTKANLFPDRNKFCAQYIKQKTGVDRTARQVGSRIQMLRGKWRGTKLFQLVALPRELDGSGNVDANEHYKGATRGSNNSLSPTSDYPVSPTATSLRETPASALGRPPILAERAPSLMHWTGVNERPGVSDSLPYLNGSVSPKRSSSASKPRLGLTPLITPPAFDTKSPASHYNCVVELPNAIQSLTTAFSTTNHFSSPIPLAQWSIAKIYLDNICQGQEIVWVQLMSTQGPREKESGNYVTQVAPAWMNKISSSQNDANRYTVNQTIYTAREPRVASGSQPTSPTPEEIQELSTLTPIYVMVYKFRVSSQGWPQMQSHAAINDTVTTQGQLPPSGFMSVPHDPPLPPPSQMFRGVPSFQAQAPIPTFPRFDSSDMISPMSGLKEGSEGIPYHPTDPHPLPEGRSSTSLHDQAYGRKTVDEEPAMGSLRPPSDYGSPVSPIQQLFSSDRDRQGPVRSPLDLDHSAHDFNISGLVSSASGTPFPYDRAAPANWAMSSSISHLGSSR